MYYITAYQPIEMLIDIQNWLDDNTTLWNWYINIANTKIIEKPENKWRRISMMVNPPKQYPFQVGFLDIVDAMAFKLQWS